MIVGRVSSYTAYHKRMQLIVSAALALMEAAVQGIGFNCDTYLYILVLRKSISNIGKLDNEHIMNPKILP